MFIDYFSLYSVYVQCEGFRAHTDFLLLLQSLFGASLAALKRVHDPAWIMNPGVLVEESLCDESRGEDGSGGGGGGGAALEVRLAALEEKLDTLIAKL